MKSQALDTDLNTSSAPAPCGITIIYEDRETGLRAKRFGDMLNASLGSETRRKPALWRLELIDLPHVTEQLSRDAAASEFLILSLRGDMSFSTAVKQWLESWLDTATPGTTHLVALFDPERSVAAHAESMRCYLREVASEAGIAFFAHCAAAPTKDNSRKLSQAGARIVSSSFSTALTATLLPAAVAA